METTEIEYKWATNPNQVKLFSSRELPKSLLAIADSQDNKIHISYGRIAELIVSQIKTLFSPSDLLFEIEESLPKGYKLFTYRLKYNPLDEEKYEEIRSLIEIIDYPPLSLSVEESNFPILPGEKIPTTTVGEAENLRLQAMVGLRSIVDALVRKKEKLIVRNVIQNFSPEVGKLTFVPHDQKNRLIYLSPEERRTYQILHQLEHYYGWRYLSDSPLTLYILQKMSTSLPVREVEEFYIIPTDTEHNYVLEEVELQVGNLIWQRYLTLNTEIPDYRIVETSENKLSDFFTSEGPNQLYLDLIDRFQHHLISSGTEYSYTIDEDNQSLFKWCPVDSLCPYDQDPHDDSPAKSKSYQVTFYGPPVIQANKYFDQIGSLASWFDQSVSRISQHLLPIMTLTGKWQDLQSGSKMEMIARLRYVSNLAYKDLNQPYLSLDIWSVDVKEDLSILAPVSNLTEYMELTQKIETITSQQDYLDWSTWLADSLSDLVAIRLAIHQKISEVSTFGTRVDDRLYLVINQRIEPSLLEEIIKNSKHQINIDYYLTHLPVQEINSSETQIVNREQLLSSENDKLITLESLSRTTFYPEGWMGWFDINLTDKLFLPGIYKQPPVRKLNPIDFGQITVEGLLSPDSYRDEIILAITVGLGESSLRLFDISYGRENGMNYFTELEEKFIQQMSDLLNWLWKSGWFLSPWQESIKLEKDNRTQIIRRLGLISLKDGILKDASEDPISGGKAVDYLDQVSKLIGSG
jgi:hypothetical protein